MPSSPVVKFRLTAVLPASVTPRFASAPPTEDGRRTPVDGDAARWAWIHFFNSSAAVRVWLKVSCLPVESAMATDDHWRLAELMKRCDSVLAAFLRYSAACVPSSRTRWCRCSELTFPAFESWNIGVPT